MPKLIYAVLLVNPDNEEKLFDIVSSIKGYAALPLYIIQLNKLAAIVSNIPPKGLDKKVANLLAYANVIETLMIDYTIMPMRFGSIAESTDQVFAMLFKNTSNFEQKLLGLVHKSEFGLKINFDSEQLKEAFTINAKQPRNDSENISIDENSSIFRQYVEKKLNEHRIEDLYSTLKETVKSRVIEFLNPLNETFFFDKHPGKKNIIDTYILTEITKKDQLMKMVNQLQLEFVSISFTLTGPWPPFNFADIILK